MGRGRQKAKHQKVARALKYQTSTVDLSALEHELSSEEHRAATVDHDEADDTGDDYHAGRDYDDEQTASGY